VLRVRIGEGWASDPAVRDALRAEKGASRRSAVRSIVDVLAVEVDGVDIGSGRTEGPLLEGVLALLGAVDRLAAGEGHASVPFEDGAVELVLHRRGGSALASVVTLGRPARVLAHDVEVDLPRLAEAAREAARSFCERVASVAPAAIGSPELRLLLRAASRRTSLAVPPVAGAPTTRSRRARRRPRDPACSFEIHDEAGRLSTWKGPGADLASLLVLGRVSLRSASGEDILSIEGTPFLIFRDLCAAAERLAGAHGGAVSFEIARPGRQATATVSVERGAVSVDGGRPAACDPLALSQAILDGANDFCAVVRSRAPTQGKNALLSDLEASARATLAQVREARAGDRPAAAGRPMRLTPSPRVAGHPLAPGRLRKVSFRRIASSEVGAPAPDGLFRNGSVVLACGWEAVRAFDTATGTPLWSGSGAALAALAEGALVTLRDGRLVARDSSTGAVRWERAAPRGTGGRPSLSTAPGGRVVLASGPSTTAFDSTSGATAWAFESPGALRLSPLPLGSLVILAADSGMIHAVDPSGQMAWRLRGAGPLAAPPVRDGRTCLLCFRTPTGATLASVEASTGIRVFETSLEFAPSGAPVRFAGRIAISGRVGGDVLVAALEEDGAPAWIEPSPTGSAVALAALPGGLLAKGPDGSCAALDRLGRTVWSRSCDGRPAPPGNLAAVPVRGLVVVAAEEVDLLDAASGEQVGRLPIHAPARLSVDGDLTTWTLDAEGLVTGARLRGHLSVLHRPGDD
jgi:outer membrane protein assembly factor BamB